MQKKNLIFCGGCNSKADRTDSRQTEITQTLSESEIMTNLGQLIVFCLSFETKKGVESLGKSVKKSFIFRLKNLLQI